MEEVRHLAAKLRDARTLTEHKRATETLLGMFDTPRFCKALNERGAESSDGWSTMLKSVVIGLANDERRAERAEHVRALKEL
eukprot:6821645-Prymnesium_polylepis.1